MKTGLRTLWRWLAGVLLLTASAAHAADTDLFAGTIPNTGTPNVLFVIDTGASFSASNDTFRCNIDPTTREVNVIGAGVGFLAANNTALDKTNGGVEQCALYSVLRDMMADTPKVNVGFMFFNSGMKTFNPAYAPTDTSAWGTECESGIGGCLAMKVTPLNTSNGRNILEYVRQWQISGNSNYLIKAPANRGDGATMQEAWAYFNAKTGISGRTYLPSELPTTGCGSNVIIFLGNNYNTQASPKDVTNTAGSPWLRLTGDASVPAGQRALPAAEPGEKGDLSATDSTMCGIKTLDGTDEGKGGRALNWALYLKNHDISTISIGIFGPSCDATYGVQLKQLGSPAIGGGGFAETTDYESIKKALLDAFGRVKAKNSVFAAVSLPVSVNTQGSYLNRVYIGMFRPDGTFKPRWNGNLKQYKLDYVGTDLKLIDADGDAAINTVTGFVGECKRSYWTPKTVDTYWTFAADGDCDTIANSRVSNYPDGNIVEKGAQAYVLRTLTPASRTVKTCSPVLTSCSSLTSFDTSNAAITDTLLQVPAGQKDNLINWARGQNLSNPAELQMSSSVMRGSAHGDVVHSRPVAVNHGTDLAPQIVVYYGSNDGMLHAINGNRNDPTNVSVGQITSNGTTFGAGTELWSFMPPQFWGKIKRLYDNNINVYYPNTPSPDAQPKDYGMDGPITAVTGTIGGSNKSVIFASMRRGGRIVYAFDVTVPGAPSLLWKAGCPNLTDDTGCMNSGATDYTGIGQTWASLKSLYVAGYQSGNAPLLIMGGGYDNCEDYDARTAGGANHQCTGSSKGKKIYVIDAADGTIQASFDTDRGVIADATLVRDNANGKIKYAYTADLGGNVYRIDFVNPADGAARAKDAWTIKKIASLGCDALVSCTANRKFMFAPSVVTDDDGYTYYLGLGSGDREKPVDYYTASKAVTNYFFMIKDRPSVSTWTTDIANCGASTQVLCKDSLLAIANNGANATAADLATKKGWSLGLAPTEQVVTSAVTVYGVTNFSTHQPQPPDAAVCSINLGRTNLYAVEYKTANPPNGATSRYDHVVGDGLPPSPVAGQIRLDDGRVVPFCIGCSKDSPLEGKVPPMLIEVMQPKNRLYWYIQK